MFQACSSSNHIAWAWMQTALTTAATRSVATSSPRCERPTSDVVALSSGCETQRRQRPRRGGRHPVVIDPRCGTLKVLRSVDAEQRREEPPGVALRASSPRARASPRRSPCRRRRRPRARGRRSSRPTSPRRGCARSRARCCRRRPAAAARRAAGARLRSGDRWWARRGCRACGRSSACRARPTASPAAPHRPTAWARADRGARSRGRRRPASAGAGRWSAGWRRTRAPPRSTARAPRRCSCP